jgi:hypothetical protein
MKLTKQKENLHQMAAQAAMLTYHKAIRELQKFQTENESVFTKYNQLQENLEVAENILRTETKQAGESLTNGIVLAKYIMPKHRHFSIPVIRKYIPKELIDAMDLIVPVEHVDEKALKLLVKSGKVKKDILQKALVEEDTGAPRVEIILLKKKSKD